MIKIKNIEIPLEKIKKFCTQWQVIEFALFGSVLRDDFRPDSDIDVMVKFDINAHPTFANLEDMETELKTIFNREVDLITRNGIESSRNYLRRQEILSSIQVIYEQRHSIGKKLEALKGDRKGQRSIRINAQFRLCFVWSDNGVTDVEIVDYH